MTKFFRQYSRFFLLLFMSVLMVVFVIGDAIGRGTSAAADALDIRIGEAFNGTEIRNSDLNRAMSDLQLARSINLIPTPFAQLGLISEDQNEQRIGVYLMMHEAERLGVRVAPGQLQDLLNRMGMTNEQFKLLANGYGRRSSKQVYESLGRVMAVGLLFQSQADAGFGQPLPQLEEQYRAFRQNAKVKVSVVDANAFLTQDEPTDEQLTALFEAGKDRLDEQGGEELAFGYQLPDRVKIEWITLNPKKLEDDVTIRETDAERYYRNNQDRYRGAATTPGTQAPLQPYEDVREQVRQTVRSLKAIEVARREINLIRESVARPWSNGTPAADQVVDFASAMAQSQYADRIVLRETEWMTREDLAALPLLGGARIQVDNRRLAAPEVAFNLEGLVEPSEDSSLDIVQVGQPGPVLTTFDTRATGRSEPFQPIAFRVVELKQSGPPASMDEVRAKLVSDWRMQQAMDTAGTYAQELAEQARSIGLDQAVADAEALRTALQTADSQALTTDGTGLEIYAKRLAVVEPPRFPRFATNVSGVRSTALHDKIYEMASDTSDHRVVAVGAPDSKAWIVAELVEVDPLYQGEFDAQRAQFEGQGDQLLRFRFARLWCEYDKIVTRSGFVPDPTAETEAEAEDEEETETSQ